MQAAWGRLLTGGVKRVVGHKIGLAVEASRRQFGVEEPDMPLGDLDLIRIERRLPISLDECPTRGSNHAQHLSHNGQCPDGQKWSGYVGEPRLSQRQLLLDDIKSRLMAAAQGRSGAVMDVGHLYGRDRERLAIEQALDAIIDGNGQAVAIRGPAGIGKTELLGFVHARATAQGMRVLRCRGEQLEQEFPWEGVRRLFRPLGWQSMGSLLGSAESEPVKDGPSLGAVLHRLYWRTVELAREGPLVLAVDDVHWLDDPSVRWLAYMQNRLEGERILLAAAVRGGEVPDRSGAWSSFFDGAIKIQLGPLDEVSAGHLLAARMGWRPEPTLAAECWRQTGGNPFLVSELARGLRVGVTKPEGRMEGALLEAEQAAAVSIAPRLRRLGVDSQRVAWALAVLGPQATPARAAALSGLGYRRTSAAIDRILADGLVELGPPLTFVHPLLRTAAYEDIPASARGDFHLEAARMLHATALEAEAWGPHLLRATASGNRWTVDRLREAAREASARATPETAARYLVRAEQEPPPPDEQVPLLISLATVETQTNPVAGTRRYRQVLSVAADWHHRAQARIGLANALSYAGDFAGATGALEQGLQEIPSTEDELRDELLAALLNSARYHPQMRPRCRPFIEGLRRRHAQGSRMSPSLRANLALDFMCESMEREATFREAVLAIDQLAGASIEGVMWPGLVLTPIACAGHIDVAVRYSEQLIGQIRRSGWTSPLAVTLAAKAKLLLWRGDVTTALMDAAEARAMAEDPISRAWAANFLSEAYRLRGQLDEAWSVLEESSFTGDVPPVWPYPMLLADRALLRRDRTNDLKGALRDLLDAGKFFEESGIRCPAVMPWQSRAATILDRIGDRKQALHYVSAELEDARRWGEAGTLGGSLRALAALESGEQRLTRLREAVAALEASERRLEHVEALIDLGACLRRAGARREAQPFLRRAVQMADMMGALAARGRALEELATAGARPRRMAIRGRDALTPGELRVAMLASQGRSNPEIAKLLFVTRRTVETHLTQSYAKLEIRRREELANVLT